MLLAFDVGNTNIVLGVFKEGKLIENWRLETDPRKSADEYGMLINQLCQGYNYSNSGSISFIYFAAFGDEVF